MMHKAATLANTITNSARRRDNLNGAFNSRITRANKLASSAALTQASRTSSTVHVPPRRCASPCLEIPPVLLIAIPERELVRPLRQI